MGSGRLVVVITVILLVPGLSWGSVLLGRSLSLGDVAATSALLSLAVVAYLVALVREWARIEHRTQHSTTGSPTPSLAPPRTARASGSCSSTSTGSRS
jgi:hypothetical protein